MRMSTDKLISVTDYDIRFPGVEIGLEQDKEWFEYDAGDGRQRMRIHDYAEMFSVPGLYEALVYDRLACSTPRQLVDQLERVLADGDFKTHDLRVMDLGAGNGILAEELKSSGIAYVVGVDRLPEARTAAERDRPGVYDDYLVANLCSLGEPDKARLDDHRLNCLVIAAALGFGDIPPAAFASAFNALAWEGWVGLTIKEDFLGTDDDSGFAMLLNRMIDRQVIELCARHRYCHRLSIGGERLYYLALVARKLRDLPVDLIPEPG